MKSYGQTRRNFIKHAANITLGTMALQSFSAVAPEPLLKKIGVQLYTFREAMNTDPVGTLKKIASLGIKEIETARSNKGNYYGLKPSEMQKICGDHNMRLRSGHVHIDENWKATMNEAAEARQDYLICSTMPTEGQTTDNYKKVAEVFNRAGEECKKLGIRFGYHNHDYEFASENGTVLYDVLLQNTDPQLVHMELDLGWVIASGKDPLDYFERFPKRFPLWHLKDMNLQSKESTEFGKGALNIKQILANSHKSGLIYPFIEQEEYASTPFESMQHNMQYLRSIRP